MYWKGCLTHWVVDTWSKVFQLWLSFLKDWSLLDYLWPFCCLKEIWLLFIAGHLTILVCCGVNDCSFFWIVALKEIRLLEWPQIGFLVVCKYVCLIVTVSNGQHAKMLWILLISSLLCHGIFMPLTNLGLFLLHLFLTFTTSPRSFILFFIQSNIFILYLPLALLPTSSFSIIPSEKMANKSSLSLSLSDSIHQQCLYFHILHLLYHDILSIFL